MVYGIIMAGGKGERFWPLSRIERPKQFLRLTSDKTMLEETIDRIKPLIPVPNVRIVTATSMVPLIEEYMDGLRKENILAEPFGRNTCLAIGLAAVHVRHEDPEAVMVVLSADHLIKPPEALLKILEDGSRLAARHEKLITIGIVPTRPETGYGYIKLGDRFDCDCDSDVFEVAAFAEKPKAAVAQEYYFSHKYLWNSGMFIWSARAILKEIADCMPDHGKQLEAYAKTIGTAEELEARQALYREATSISIDYAVLEKASNVLTIKADIIWDDVGSWNSLPRYKGVNRDSNVLIGNVITHESYETTVYNDAEGLIACLGVSDLVIVRSGDVTMVAHRTQLDKIKELLAKIGDDEKNSKYL